jgi:RHS repeat-associated protein
MENHWWLDDQDRKKLEFTYDYQGRRVSKRVQTWPVGAPGYLPATETRFLYDGWNLIAEFTSTSTSPLNWSVARSYTWGLDLIGSLTASGGVGALVQITDHADGQSYLPGYDGNGNVAVLVRASDGYRAAAYEYGPYGEVLRSEGTYAAQNTFRFSTKFTDVESGLVYYGMRYYDARNGRFINRDPIEERGGLNLYGFCGNDGVNRYDVLGMSWLSKAFKKLKKWMGKHKWAMILTTVVLGAITGGYALTIAPAAWGSVGAAAFAGGVGGFTSGLAGGVLSGQNFGDSLLSGLKGAAIGAVTGAVMAKATEWFQAKFTPAENQNMDLYHIRKTNAGIEQNLIDANSLAPEQLNGKLWINGQSNDLTKAIDLGFRNTNSNEFYMGWNRTTSGFMDSIESTLDKISGQSPISRSAAKILSKFDLPNTRIYAHSQGTLIARNALAIRAAAGQAIKGVTVAYEGAAVNLISTRLAFSKIDAKLVHFGTHPFDAVPNLIGYNAFSMPNPYRIAGSILSAPLLAIGGEWSPHTYPGGGQHLRFFPDAY